MKWSDKIVFITDAQSGFKLGVANVYDTIFALQSIIDKHLSNMLGFLTIKMHLKVFIEIISLKSL